jgi:hypothetical protein
MDLGEVTMKKQDLADHLRYLVADADAKLSNEYMDRQMILEDLLGRLLEAAQAVDSRLHVEPWDAYAVGFPNYPMAERSSFGDLAGPRMDVCPFDFGHTRQWCGFDTCRES